MSETRAYQHVVVASAKDASDMHADAALVAGADGDEGRAMLHAELADMYAAADEILKWPFVACYLRLMAAARVSGDRSDG